MACFSLPALSSLILEAVPPVSQRLNFVQEILAEVSAFYGLGMDFESQWRLVTRSRLPHVKPKRLFLVSEAAREALYLFGSRFFKVARFGIEVRFLAAAASWPS